MIEAVAISVASILLGALVGSVSRSESSWLGPLRTFAIAAVAAAVIVQLLPESVAEIGGGALLLFVGALLLPGLLAPLARRLRPSAEVSTHQVGAELGFYGFLLHQLAEGLALGTVVGEGHEHAPLVLAVSAHTLPLTAVFVVEALAHGGRRTAMRRVVSIVLATVVGFALAGVAHDRLHLELHPWLAAAIAGLLVHVIFHHDHQRRGGRTAWVGALDVLGAGIGVGLPLLAAARGDDHGGGEVRARLVDALGPLVLELAPVLLVALVLAAVVQAWGPGRSFGLARGGTTLSSALRGLAAGASRSPSAHALLDAAETQRRQGAAPAWMIAFLVGTPALGLEALVLSGHLLGWTFALVRLLAAIALALLAAVLVAGAMRTPTTEGTTSDGEPSGSMPSRVLVAFDDRLQWIAPWTMVGLLAAAFVDVVLDPGALRPLADAGLDVLLVALVALPTYVCPAAAVPLFAVLVVEGLSSGGALVGLLLGPAVHLAALAVLRRGYGSRVAGLGLLATLGLGVGLGLLADAAGVRAHVPAELGRAHGPGVLAEGAVVLLGLALLVQLWRHGARPWLRVLEGTPAPGHHAHGHGHGHGHGHEHGHHH